MHRRQIIETVGQGQSLVVGPVLGKFFHAPVQKTDMRRGFFNDLAIQLQDQLQNPVRGRMLGAHIYGH